MCYDVIFMMYYMILWYFKWTVDGKFMCVCVCDEMI